MLKLWTFIRIFQLIVVLVVCVIFVILLHPLLLSKCPPSPDITKTKYGSPFQEGYLFDDDFPRKVAIATVCCSKGSDDNATIVKAAVMIKSVLVSAIMYRVTYLDFHLFMIDTKHETYFLEKLKEFGTLKWGIQIRLHFHSMISSDNKTDITMSCGHIRYTLPSALADVDSILYLNPDFLITGNIWEVWKHLFKMQDEEMIGIVPNSDQFNHNCFKVKQIIPPNGVNTDMMLMNLTRLRLYEWDRKIAKIEKGYGISQDDAEYILLNVAGSLEPKLVYYLPCQFNIKYTTCDPGFICSSISQDPYGIHCINGAEEQFDEGGRFHDIYQLYKQFRFENQSIFRNLIKSIKDIDEPLDRNDCLDKCVLPLNKFLFKNIYK